MLNLKSIRSKFILVAILVSVIPVVFLGIISYNISKKVVEDNHMHSYDVSLQTSNEMINITLRGIVDITRVISVNKVIQEELTSFSRNQDNYNSFPQLATLILDSELKSILSNQTEIAFVTLIDNQGYQHTFSNSTIYDINEKTYTEDTLRKEKWYNEVIKRKGTEVFLGYNVLNSKKNGNTFVCIKSIKNLSKLGDIGILVLGIDKSVLANAFPKDKYKDEQYQGNFLIVDEWDKESKNIVIQSNKVSDENILFNLIDDIRDSQSFKNNKWLAGIIENEITGWKVVYLADRSGLIRDTNKIKTATIIICIIVVSVVASLSILVTYTINKPLDKLEKAITDVAAGKRNITEEFNEDEIGKIGNQFKKLVNENIELNEKLIFSSLKQKEAELIALQAQINPHFLYNTLDSMYWLAKIKKADDVAQMAVSLSEIFKLSLNKGSEITTINDEIKHIRNYLTIQNLRFKDKFKVEINIDESILGYSIIKLILQPIVENAIYHGLEPKVGEGHIRIEGRMVLKQLIFIVEDDGVGMNSVEDVKYGYGVKNVIERMKLYYGDEYGLDFESEAGKGTKVTINIPANMIINSQGQD